MRPTWKWFFLCMCVVHWCVLHTIFKHSIYPLQLIWKRTVEAREGEFIQHFSRCFDVALNRFWFFWKRFCLHERSKYVKLIGLWKLMSNVHKIYSLLFLYAWIKHIHLWSNFWDKEWKKEKTTTLVQANSLTSESLHCENGVNHFRIEHFWNI